jgi:hypothetical protein
MDDKYTNSDGSLKKEGLDYMCARLAIAGGSTHETVKIGRKLNDGIQTIGLNNAEIYGCIAGLKAKPPTSPTLRMVKSGNTYNIEDMNGEKRFAIDMARGRMRLVSKDAVTKVVESINTSEHQEQNLIMTFLKGQQSLLEKLIDQTT